MAECGSWCVYYTSRSIEGHCKQCELYIHTERIEFGAVNPFELTKKLAQKRENERRDKIPLLSDCPYCHTPKVLFYDKIADNFYCYKEKMFKAQTGTTEYKAIVMKFYDVE